MSGRLNYHRALADSHPARCARMAQGYQRAAPFAVWPPFGPLRLHKAEEWKRRAAQDSGEPDGNSSKCGGNFSESDGNSGGGR